MKNIHLILIIILTSNSLFSQEGYIYKREPLTGVMEIFKSSSGTPTGSPLATIKKNTWGYLEVLPAQQNSFTQSFNTQTHWPQLIPIQPYLAPVADIINTTNTYLKILNNKGQVQQSLGNDNKKGVENLDNMFKPFQQKAKTLKGFLTSLANKPDTIMQGWHNVLILTKMDETIQKLIPGEQLNSDSIGEVGYAYVKGNRIDMMLEQQLDLKQYLPHIGNFITGTIKNCQAFLKEGDKIIEVLFIDYAIDQQPLQSRPKFGAAIFNYPMQKDIVFISIYDWNNPNNKNPVGIVPTMKNDGRNVFVSIPGKYRYIVQDIKNLNSEKFLAEGFFEIIDKSNQTVEVK